MVATPEAMENADKKVATRKEAKKVLEERFKTGKNRWFFTVSALSCPMHARLSFLPSYETPSILVSAAISEWSRCVVSSLFAEAQVLEQQRAGVLWSLGAPGACMADSSIVILFSCGSSCSSTAGDEL